MSKKLLKIVAIPVAVFAVAQIALASFSDVNVSAENYDAVTYAQENGIVSGYPDGTFKPDNHINRAEFTKIVVGAALDYNSSKDPSGNDIFSLTGLSFSDLLAGQWYVPYLRKAVEHKIISGYPDGSFKPEQEINFAEAAKIIVRALGYVTTDDVVWYRPYVTKLGELNAIPVTVTTFNHKITRGEMVEIIYRLKAGVDSKSSLNYAQVEANSGLGNNTSPSPTPATQPTQTQETSQQSSSNPPMISSSCSVFPADNPWNRDVSQDPLDPNSDNYIANITASGGNQNLHADFGGNGEYGIPYAVVSETQPKVAINITDYADQSDPGPYPIPDNASVENGSDAHVLVVDKDACKLYELYAAEKTSSGWNASSAAIFDLNSNALRPDGWTSADAAGLPIFPGLARYDEVTAGSINHALRFTVKDTQKGYIHPATHYASDSTDANRPPMGLRLRLKSDFDTSSFTGESKVILEALKKYGMIVADNGSNWYITGDSNTGWDDEDLNQLKTVPGTSFEVVQSGQIIK